MSNHPTSTIAVEHVFSDGVIHEALDHLDGAAIEVVSMVVMALAREAAHALPLGAADSYPVNRLLYASAAAQALAPLADPLAAERVTMSVGPDDQYTARWHSPGQDGSPVVEAEMSSELEDPLGVTLRSDLSKQGDAHVVVGAGCLTPAGAILAAKALLVAGYLATEIERQDEDL